MTKHISRSAALCLLLAACETVTLEDVPATLSDTSATLDDVLSADGIAAGRFTEEESHEVMLLFRDSETIFATTPAVTTGRYSFTGASGVTFNRNVSTSGEYEVYFGRMEMEVDFATTDVSGTAGAFAAYSYQLDMPSRTTEMTGYLRDVDGTLDFDGSTSGNRIFGTVTGVLTDGETEHDLGGTFSGHVTDQDGTVTAAGSFIPPAEDMFSVIFDGRFSAQAD